MKGLREWDHQFKLPFPPSVNHYWNMKIRRSKIVGKVSARGKAFRADVAAIILQEHGIIRMEGRIEMVIACVMPDKRKRDVDNLGKAVLDALEFAGVYRDDNQVDDLRLIRGPVMSPGWIIVRLGHVLGDDYEDTFFNL